MSIIESRNTELPTGSDSIFGFYTRETQKSGLCVSEVIIKKGSLRIRYIRDLWGIFYDPQQSQIRLVFKGDYYSGKLWGESIPVDAITKIDIKVSPTLLPTKRKQRVNIK